jgi:hypothetical protein
MQGRLMEEKIIVANTTVRLGDRYINGVYIVNARQGDEQAHIKLIKQGTKVIKDNREQGKISGSLASARGLRHLEFSKTQK